MSQITQKAPPQRTSVNVVRDMITGLTPFDGLEAEHMAETLAWVESGEPIFRTQKPDKPSKHLVSYFVLLDDVAQKVLLVDHKRAQLWLPPGGHVEVDEHPKKAVVRECFEELNIQAKFWCEEPIFLTSTKIVELTATHTDVSLWYVLQGDCQQNYDFDRGEFNGICWFGFDDIPYDRADPHMSRFMSKLQGCI